MAIFFKVKSYKKFQHYKNRNPPWIKLYNELLDDYDFECLQDASKLHLILIWLLASRYDNKIPFNREWVTKKVGTSNIVDLDELEKAGFIQRFSSENDNDSNMLAERKQIAILETERETEREGERAHARENPSPQKKEEEEKEEKEFRSVYRLFKYFVGEENLTGVIPTSDELKILLEACKYQSPADWKPYCEERLKRKRQGLNVPAMKFFFGSDFRDYVPEKDEQKTKLLMCINCYGTLETKINYSRIPACPICTNEDEKDYYFLQHISAALLDIEDMANNNPEIVRHEIDESLTSTQSADVR